MSNSKCQRIIFSESMEDENLIYVELEELKFGSTKFICSSRDCEKTDCIYSRDVIDNPYRQRTLTPVLRPANSSID